MKHTFFCILITLVHFFTNNPLEGEVESGLNSSLLEEGQISDQVVRRQKGGINTKSRASSRKWSYVFCESRRVEVVEPRFMPVHHDIMIVNVSDKDG